MKQPVRKALAALALTASCIAFGAPAQADSVGGVPTPVQACQRECLEGFVNRYLAAMAAHKVDPELFAQNVRFTENGIELPFGNEGLWATASGVGQYKLYVPDTETQQVAFLGTVKEVARSSATGAAREPELVGLALRLRIEGGKITEVEQIAARPDRPIGGGTAAASSNPFPATGEAVEKMGAPAPIFSQAIPEKERMSRAELIAVGNAYFEGLQRNDGKGYYPFTDDCIRFENGMDVLANYPNPETGKRERMGCKKQFEVALKGTVTGIRDRRFVAVDRERGIVFAFGFFDHRPINWTWQLGELFKIEKGEISRIEAIFIRGPYGINSGWSTYEQGRSEEIQDIR
ncbi:hypothetical protein [Altererythrobacter fulvus]|uniref:hypothetical protein n=1 Tax=Caenibius fulvus TaxID=2126012 RepID=UPI0030187CD6